jgi:hypothetical protein
MFTIRKDDNYQDVLQENNADKICPFQTPVPVPMQNALGQTVFTLMRMPCSSVCPFVEITDMNQEKNYWINCTGKPLMFDIAEPTTTPIIQL